MRHHRSRAREGDLATRVPRGRSVRAAIAAVIAILAPAGAAFADHHRIADGDAPPVADGQVVLVNATTKIGDLGQLDRIRRALDQRGMLFRLPESLEATLDQRNVLVADLDAIKEAYANMD